MYSQLMTTKETFSSTTKSGVRLPWLGLSGLTLPRNRCATSADLVVKVANTLLKLVQHWYERYLAPSSVFHKMGRIHYVT